MLDRYEILEQIGEGAMGTVYRGLDRRTGERVAVKELRDDVVDENTVERFRREGELLRRLNHPNIVQLRDAFESNEHHFLVMEYVTGGSLREMLDRTSRLDVPLALPLAIEAADALTRAHHLGVVHRDIKPENVLLAEDGTPRLADFGIARTADSRLTATGLISGTLSYVSPEVLDGEDASPRSDVWSFGVMLFEMLTGTLPFRGGHRIAALFNAIVNDPVPDIERLRPDLPSALVDLLYRMLAKQPAERIPSFRVVGAELEAIHAGRDGSAFRAATLTPHPGTSVAIERADNLPAPTTAFVGREPEVAGVERALAESRLLTILGQGGIGKTRLGLEVARRIKEEFAHGVLFVPLARIDSPQYLAQTIVEEMRLTLASQQDAKAMLIESLRAKEMLLVLDNFEHVVEGRDLLPELLESAPGLRILTTSRERLDLQGEAVYSLSSMRTGTWRTVEDALESDAVQLFVQGARRARAGFALRPSDLVGVARVCRLVEGLPLAILLAAAWVDTLSVDEIAAEIAKSSTFLETELSEMPARHRSVRAVFDSTWNRLTPSDQELFASLSVFRGSFNREAAQEVAGATLRGLARLAARSLITRDPDSGRYHIHELLRQYGETQLERSPTWSSAVRDAHGAYFASFMEERWSHVTDYRAPVALREIRDDIENVRAAWRMPLGQRTGDQLARFFSTIWISHETWGWFQPAIDLYREARVASAGPEDGNDAREPMHGLALAGEGWFLSLIGSPDRGLPLALEGLEILKRSDADLLLAVNGVNINAIFLNRLDVAGAASRDLLESARRREDAYGVAFANIWLAFTAAATGCAAEAEQYAESATATLEARQDPFGLSVMYGIVLGAIRMMQGQLEGARQAYERGLRSAAAIDYRRVIQLARDSLGTIALLEGRLDEARASFLKSLRITYEDGQQREQLGSLRDIATVYATQGNPEKAVELLAVVLQHPARVQNSLSRPESLETESTRLLDEIRVRFPADQYDSAWRRGASFRLGTVIEDLLQG